MHTEWLFCVHQQPMSHLKSTVHRGICGLSTPPAITQGMSEPLQIAIRTRRWKWNDPLGNECYKAQNCCVEKPVVLKNHKNHHKPNSQKHPKTGLQQPRVVSQWTQWLEHTVSYIICTGTCCDIWLVITNHYIFGVWMSCASSDSSVSAVLMGGELFGGRCLLIMDSTPLLCAWHTLFDCERIARTN